MQQQQELEVRELRVALEQGESVVSLHYACESFITAKDHPTGIAALAFFDLQAREVIAYSRSDAPPEIQGVDREIDLLERFYSQLEIFRESHVLHWNMNRPEFGFPALATRYRYLTGKQPGVSPPPRLHDVDTLLSARFGEDYAPHGRLESTARLNGMDMRSFLTGKDEAQLFDKTDWSAITRSCASKAKIIGELLRRLADGQVKTMGSAGQVRFAGGRLDAVDTVLELGNRFLLVQRSLGKHPHGKPGMSFDDEYDDQYLLRALLTQFFEDVRDEEYTPSYAGSNSRVDFLLPEFELAVELKHTRHGLSDKELGEQLLVDRERYKKHASVTHLLALVFDHDGHLRNPRGLEKDLRREHSDPELTVTVRIYDR